MQNLELLFEIGCEEIPARFVPTALAHLSARAALLESEYGLPVSGDIATFGSPRRLCLSIVGLPAETSRSQKEVVGPALRAAYDASGQPTKACIGFAKSAGVAPEQLQKRTMPKGEYVVALVEQGGEPTTQVLQRFLLDALTTMPLAKSMRWESDGARFFRPIRWLLAVLSSGESKQVIPLAFAGLTATDTTRGHRFMSPGPVTVTSRGEYLSKLRESYVLVDVAERRAAVLTAARAAARAAGGFLLFDRELTQQAADPLAEETFFTGLLDEVTYLCEWPVGVDARFDASALALPRELLLTAMRKHQRYFAVCDGSGELLPALVTIAATRVSDPDLVRRGNARVLKARLSDASYFAAEDLKRPLASRLTDLKSVVYHKKLGTSYAKAERALQLAWDLARKLGRVEGEPESLEKYLASPTAGAKLGRAAALAKADLSTLTVNEFPELQGSVGSHIARAQGEDADVALAISEHYRPRSAEDGLPQNELGALVAFGDKLDTLVGIIAAGPMPTGSSDPYALRRNALGVLRILLERQWSVRLSELIGSHVKRFDDKIIPADKAESVTKRTLEFVAERFLQQQLPKERGLGAQVVRAVVAAGFDDPLQASYRISALQSFSASADFEALTATLKRVLNILKTTPEGEVSAELMQHDAERKLYGEIRHALELKQSLAGQLSVEAYVQRLRAFSELRGSVDAFFDNVMVMDENLSVRQNRLQLLRDVAALVADIADFKEI